MLNVGQRQSSSLLGTMSLSCNIRRMSLHLCFVYKASCTVCSATYGPTISRTYNIANFISLKKKLLTQWIFWCCILTLILHVNQAYCAQQDTSSTGERLFVYFVVWSFTCTCINLYVFVATNVCSGFSTTQRDKCVISLLLFKLL